MEKSKLSDISGVVFLAVSILVFISLVSFDPGDLGFYTSSPNIKTANFAGLIGAYISFGLLFSVGFASYIIPFLTFLWAVSRFARRQAQKVYVKAIGTVMLFLSASSLLSLIVPEEHRVTSGGVVGVYMSDVLMRYFGRQGSVIVVFALFIISSIVATEFLIVPLLTGILKAVCLIAAAARDMLFALFSGRRKIKISKPEPLISPSVVKIKQSAKIEDKKPAIVPPVPKIKTRITKEEPKAASKEEPVIREAKPIKPGEYRLPTIDMLQSPPPIEERMIVDDINENAKILEDTLMDFGIEAKVMEADRGPVITRYELQPASGVKVNRIVALSDDISLAMKASSIRIVAPIPGKSRVGVEIPNGSSVLVYLKEILGSKAFSTAESKLTLALGKGISGEALVADLGDMPHILIAGTTGSGKTVCVNTMIMSLLFNNTPDELKFIMVDPKMVELAPFNGLPHLLCPVVTEAKKVAGALSWVVNEMESRYKVLAAAGVRNINAYKEKVGQMPYIVIIIDELADLMIVAQAEIENAITRLAQLSRAVGIHMILATQRPSVDVVTGVIKANFPARVSFKVASKVDSRTVLDMNGADKLLGKGDMLFLKPGTEKPIRAQASLVSDKEINSIVEFVKAQVPFLYNDEILKTQDKRAAAVSSFEDELFDEAARLVIESGQASVSMLQRRLRLSYARAGRLIDAMEAKGLVGPHRGSKSREILVSGYGDGQTQKEEV